MNFKILSAVLFVATAFPLIAQAGAISGGGGKGVVCHIDGWDSKTTVQLLDLWEAKTLFTQNLINPTGNLADDVDSALVRLKNSYEFEGGGNVGDQNYPGQDFLMAALRENAQKFLKPNAKLLRLHGVTLTQTDDSYELAQPVNCSVQQLVNYQPDDKIWLNQDLVEKMDELDQAALIVHESFYAFLRDMAGETNSIRTRRAVGFVFAGNSFELNSPKLPDRFLYCTADHGPGTGNDIVMTWKDKDKNGGPKVQFYPKMLGGSELIGTSNTPFEFPAALNYSGLFASGNCSDDSFSFESKSLLDGPVEFDRQFQLDFSCKGAVLSAYLTTSRPGQSGIEQSQLTCKLYQASATPIKEK